MDKQWFAVFTKPRQEATAQQNLDRQSFETYLPQIKQSRRNRGKWIERIEPMFPRYLFFRLDPNTQDSSPIRSSKGAVGLVRFGGEPVPVPEAVIRTLREFETDGICATAPRPCLLPKATGLASGTVPLQAWKASSLRPRENNGP